MSGTERAFVEAVAVSHELALRLVHAGIAAGEAAGIPVAVAVTDPGMGLVAFGRASGTTPHSAETSRRKAQTAASTRRPTGWMEGDLALALPPGSGNQLTNILGGFPIVVDGRFLGGFAVAGGPPATDARIAREALAVAGVEVPELSG
jgi:glc operon protein GlcG